MAGTSQLARLTKLVAVSSAAAASAFTVVACSSNAEPGPATATVTVSVPASSTASAPTSAATTPSAAPSSTASASECSVNPSSAPLTAVGPYETVPENGRVSVTLTGIPSGTVAPGAAPTEVSVTVCNDSAVDYPQAGVVVMLSHCSCAPGMQIAKGTVDRFDEATGSWIPMPNAAVGGGMDYLAGYANVQALPKGESVTFRYRVALDASMAPAGEGGVTAAAVTPEPLNQLGNADLRFTVEA